MQRRVSQNVPVLFAALLSFQCTQITEPTDPAAKEFYPLQVGNRWMYVSTNPGIAGTFIDEVVGVRQIGPYRYFAVRFSRLNDPKADTSYFRVADDGSVRILRNNRDQLFIDFYQATDVRWQSYDGYWGTIREKGFRMKVPAGIFSDCIGIFLDIPFAADDEQWYIFARGVGPIERRSAWFGTTLISAKVGNRSYP